MGKDKNDPSSIDTIPRTTSQGFCERRSGRIECHELPFIKFSSCLV
jgi:hypothetical protein